MSHYSFNKVLSIFQGTVLFILVVLLLVKAYSTLDWRMEHDTPILHYAAFLMDRYDLVPYRDIFETSMPGTFAFHYVIGKLFGYGDIAFRYIDLTLLGILLGVTYSFMRRFGRMAAIWSVTLFGLMYFLIGQTMSLQRDYVGIIPIAFSLLCIPATTNTPVRLIRFAVLGLLFGMSVLFKPHLGISLPIIFGTLLAFRWHFYPKSWFDFFKCAAVSIAFFAIPLSIAVVWLMLNSALTPFVDTLFNYLPLYNALTGNFVFISGWDRVLYLVEHTLILGGMGILLLCALFAYHNVVIQIEDKATAISVTCLCLCTFAYVVYPALAGKFWPYHYMPFAYFGSLSTGLCLFSTIPPQKSNLIYKARAVLPILALVITATVQLHLFKYTESLISDLRSGPEAHAPQGGRVDEIAVWLKARLRPGDTVQALDGIGGAIHGMLLAEAKLATPFMYDNPFYHHVSSAFTQKIRQSFMMQLRKASPRFIIVVLTNRAWVSGVDTTHEFSELGEFINNNYVVSYEGKGYRIYERASM